MSKWSGFGAVAAGFGVTPTLPNRASMHTWKLGARLASCETLRVGVVWVTSGRVTRLTPCD